MIRIERVQDLQDTDLKALNYLLPQLKSSSPPAELDMEALKSIVSNPNTTLLAAKEDERIIGCLVLVVYRNLAKTRAWIENVIVDEKHRNKGIGRLLNKYAIVYAANAGASDINLMSRSNRVPANKLYKRLGFIKRDTNVYRYEVRMYIDMK